MKSIDISKVNFQKGQGLVPAIIQDDTTQKVLMLGYMNEEALQQTLDSGLVTFWSRSKRRLWQKGEESGNTLVLKDIAIDCDEDTLLIQVIPNGPTCHTGTDTCWADNNHLNALSFERLEHVIQNRFDNPSDKSYTSSLFAKGINKVAQKVGEEAIELVIEAKDENRSLFLNEAADLIYHFIVLLVAKRYKLKDVITVLEERKS